MTLFKLEREGRKIDLNTAPYKVAKDGYSPPSEVLQQAIAGAGQGSRVSGTAPGQAPFAFSVLLHITGTTVAEVEFAVSRLRSFLRSAGNADQPTFLAVRSYGSYPEPSYGRVGAAERYEVVSGRLMAPQNYSTVLVAKAGQNFRLELLLKPVNENRPIQAAIATGFIWEDHIGTWSGQSRGYSVQEAFSNKMTGDDNFTGSGTNFVFRTVYGKPELVGFRGDFGVQEPSAFVLEAGDAVAQVYETVTPGNTNTHVLAFFAKRQDGGTIDSTVIKPYHSSTAHTDGDYQYWGDGWYRVVQIDAATSTANNVGAQVEAGYAVAVCGFTYVESAMVPAPVLDHFIGTTVSGSKPTATGVGKMILSGRQYLNPTGTTLRFVWIPHQDSSSYPAATKYVFEDEDSNLALTFTSAGAWALTDGTNTATTAGGQTFTALDRLVFHAVMGEETGLVLYLNGTSIASNSSFVTKNESDSFYIGSDNTGAGQILGTFASVIPFPYAMTSADVGEDWAAINPIANPADISLLERIDPTPYLWTEAGDGLIVNHNDSDAGDTNWALFGGMVGQPSRWEALGYVKDSAGNGKDWTDFKYLRIGHLHVDYADFGTDIPDTVLYYEGEVIPQAGLSAGAYESQTVTTSDVVFGAVTETNLAYRHLAGKAVHSFGIAYDAGSNLLVASRLRIGATVIDTEYRSVSSTTAYRIFRALPYYCPQFDRSFVSYPQVMPQMLYKRSTGSAAVRVDYQVVLPNPLIAYSNADHSNGTSTGAGFSIGKGQFHVFPYTYSVASSNRGESENMEGVGELFGDQFLLGSEYTILNFLVGDEESTGYAYDDEVKIVRLLVYPQF